MEEWIAEAERLNYPLDGKVGWLGWGWQSGQPTNILSQGETSKEEDKKEESEEKEENKTESETTEKEQLQAANDHINQKVSLDNVLFIGDSITEGLSKSKLIPGAQFCAKVGANTAHWLNNINSLPQDSDSIKAVCVMLGVNDPSQTEQMKKLIDALISRYPNKTIYVQKVLPVTIKYTYNDYKVMNANINAYNQAVEAYCNGKNNVKFIDTSTGYVNSDGTGIVNLFDNAGLHPLDYNQLKSNIEKALNGINGEANKENQTAYSPKYHAVVATWNEQKTEIKSDDPTVDKSGSSAHYMSTSKVDYQTMVSGYIMPFDYLWALLVAGRSKEFSLKLADLVYDSDIEFTIYDNLTVTINEQTENYSRNETVQTKDGPVTRTRSYYKTTITTNKVNTIDAKLTFADVWIVKYSQEFTYEQTDNGGNKYVGSPPKLEEKTDPKAKEPNFVNIMLQRSCKEVRGNIASAPDWLFAIMKTSDKTKEMIDLTKYLLYKAGSNLGLKEFDFSIFDPANFHSVSVSIEGGNVQEKVWNALISQGYSEYAVAGAMGNIQHESGFDNNIIEEGYTEYNGGIGLCQWTNSPERTSTTGPGARNQMLKNYAALKQTAWQDVDTQIEFLITELNNGVGPAEGFAVNQLLNSHGYNRKSWINASSPEDAAVAFCWSFERPKSPNLTERKNSARMYYEKYKGTSTNTSNNEKADGEK